MTVGDKAFVLCAWGHFWFTANKFSIYIFFGLFWPPIYVSGMLDILLDVSPAQTCALTKGHHFRECAMPLEAIIGLLAVKSFLIRHTIVDSDCGQNVLQDI